MKMFTNCSGVCCLCSCGSYCLAGHGDDHYYPATKDQLIKRLNNGEYPYFTNTMKKYLLDVYDYDYDKECKDVSPVKDTEEYQYVAKQKVLRELRINGLILMYEE